MKAPTFFDPATIGAVGGALGGIGSIFGGGPQVVDDSKVRQQMQEREITARQAEQGRAATQRAGEVELQTQEQASRQRVEALDRIIGAFQQNLRI